MLVSLTDCNGGNHRGVHSFKHEQLEHEKHPEMKGKNVFHPTSMTLGLHVHVRKSEMYPP